MEKVTCDGLLTIAKETMVWVPLFQQGNGWIPDVEVNECVVDEDKHRARNIIISLETIMEVTSVVWNGRVDLVYHRGYCCIQVVLKDK